MGNKVSLESSDRKNSRRRSSPIPMPSAPQPPPLSSPPEAYRCHTRRTEVDDLEAAPGDGGLASWLVIQPKSRVDRAPDRRRRTQLGLEVTDMFLEEQNRIHREIQMEQERRKAAEARARQQGGVEAMMREQQRGAELLEEARQREMLKAEARQQEREQAEARRKTEEVRAMQERVKELTARRQRERLLHEAEARRVREQEEEARRKAEETHARQEREQQLKAIREQERLLREEKVRRAREEEEWRKAEEALARQQREQELAAVREESLQPGEPWWARLLETPLPQICRRHNTRQGCSDSDCRRLHICRLFLAEICKHGATCRYGHSLTTVHNEMVCNRHDLDMDILPEWLLLQQLRRVFDVNELPEANRINNLERCFKFSSRSGCDQIECNRIHICRQFIAGACGRGICKFGHDLHTTHNKGVISRYRLTKLTDDEIIDILHKKETGTEKANGATASTSTSQNGAIPRQRSAETTKQTTHQQPVLSGPEDQKAEKMPAGAALSEELQCPICLEMFNRATTLGCGHSFCAGCLQEVQGRSGAKCPLCRVTISSATRSVTLDNIIRSMAANQ